MDVKTPQWQNKETGPSGSDGMSALREKLAAAVSATDKARERRGASTGGKGLINKISGIAFFINKLFKRNPDFTSFIASIAVHCLLFIAMSYFYLDYQGTWMGNGEEISQGGNSIKIDFVSEERPKSAAVNSVYNKYATTKKIANLNGIKKSSSPAKSQPPKLKQLKSSVAAAPAIAQAKKELSLIELNDKLGVKNSKKIVRPIEIPIEIGREIGKKLKSAKLDELDAQTSEAVVKTVIDTEDDGANISLSKTEVKALDSAGELIASNVLTAAVKPVSDVEASEDIIPAGESADTLEINADSSKNGSGSKKAKAGTGPNGKPFGTKQSGLTFEIVANSSYDEVPSFLNGLPPIDYPKWAQEQGVEGNVKIMLEILPNGEVGSVAKHESPISDRLAQYLIKQAEMWRFKPIYKNGRALAGTVMVNVDFSLSDAGKNKTDRASR